MNVSIVVLTALVASVAASGLLVGGVVLLLRLRTFDASTRHALWLATIVAMALLPLAGIGASIARRVQPGSSIAAVLPGAAHTLRSRSAASDVRSLSAPSRHQTAITSHAVPQRTRGTTVTTSPQTALGALGKVAWAASLIALAALAGVALTGLVLLALSVAQIGAVKRRSSPLDETLSGDLPWLTETHRGRETYLRLSYEIEAPVAIGFSRPVILIPTELATKSGLAAIEDLVIHEHAHLRRYDDYTNLIQRVIERTFWFNPFVWFAGRRIALEREIAADDAVVERTSDRTRYADQLWRLAREMRMPAYTVVAPGALFTRKQISIRIEALLAPGRTHLRHLGPASAAGVLALALVSYALVAVAAPPLLLPAAAPSASSDAGSAGSRTVSWHAFDDNVRNSTARTADQTILALTSLSGFVSSRLTDVAAAADAPGASSSPDRITKLQGEMKVLRDKLTLMARMAREGHFHVLQQRIAALERSAAALDASLRLRSDFARTPSVQGDVAAAPPSSNAERPVTAPAPERAVQRPRTVATTNARTPTTTNTTIRPVDGARGIPGADGVNLDVHVPMVDVHVPQVDVHVPAIDVRVPPVHVHVPSEHIAMSRSAVAKAAAAEARAEAQADAATASTADAALTRTLIAKCTGCDLSHRNLRNVDLHGVSLEGADLEGADLRGANLHGARLVGDDLSKVNFEGADLSAADFSGANISGAIFRGAKMEGVRFVGIALNEAGFDAAGVREILLRGCSGCDLSDMDLRGIDLHGISLSGADFNGTNLRNANLSGARFSGVNFESANLDHADLRNATLSGCNLSGASLNGARLEGIRLSGTTLSR